jgi:hypothetical protein
MPYTGSSTQAGLEFVLDLRGPDDSHLLLDEPYNLYRYSPIAGTMPLELMAVHNLPFRSIANDDGRYDTLNVETNRRRIGRDGTVYPSRTENRSLLLHAKETESTLADWFSDAASGTIEIRIPWGMLNVMDPSSHYVLHGADENKLPTGRPTDGFRFFVQSYDPNTPLSGGDFLPRADAAAGFGTAPLWRWPGWETPTWHQVVKPLFGAMRDAFARLSDRVPVTPRQR